MTRQRRALAILALCLALAVTLCGLFEVTPGDCHCDTCVEGLTHEPEVE